MAEPRRWSQQDNEDLQNLLESGVIDPSDTSKATIEAIRIANFDWCLYRNFAQNFRKKVKEYVADKLLRGSRLGKIVFVFIFGDLLL
jgi:hypothetical protein